MSDEHEGTRGLGLGEQLQLPAKPLGGGGSALDGGGVVGGALVAVPAECDEAAGGTGLVKALENLRAPGAPGVGTDVEPMDEDDPGSGGIAVGLQLGRRRLDGGAGAGVDGAMEISDGADGDAQGGAEKNVGRFRRAIGGKTRADEGYPEGARAGGGSLEKKDPFAAAEEAGSDEGTGEGGGKADAAGARRGLRGGVQGLVEAGTVTGSEVALEEVGGPGDGKGGLDGGDEVGGTEEAELEGREVLGGPAKEEGYGEPVDEVGPAGDRGLAEVGAGIGGLAGEIAEGVGGEMAAVAIVVEPEAEREVLAGEAGLAGGKAGAPAGRVGAALEVGADAKGHEQDDARRVAGAVADGENRPGGVHGHGVEAGPALGAVDEVVEQVGRAEVAIGRVDFPDEGLGRIEGEDGAGGAGSVGQGGAGDVAGKRQDPALGAGLVEREGAGAPGEEGAVVAPGDRFDVGRKLAGMAVEPPGAAGGFEGGDPTLTDGVGDKLGGEVVARGGGDAGEGVADEHVAAEGTGLEPDGLGEEEKAVAPQPAEGPHEPGRRGGIGQVVVERAGDGTGVVGEVPAPEAGGGEAVAGGLDAGEDGAVGADGGELGPLGAGGLEEALPAGGPGPAEAAVGENAMALVGEGDGPAELGDGPEVDGRIAGRGRVGAGVVGSESLGEFLGVRPAIAVAVGGIGREGEREKEQGAHAGHPAPPRRVRKRRDTSGE